MKPLSSRSLKSKTAAVLLITALVFSIAGCGLIPKKVEFFQDKVKAVPDKTAKSEENDRRAAAFLNKAVDSAYTEAVRSNNTNSAVMVPLEAASIVAPSLAYSLGPPSHPAPDVSVLQARMIADAIDKELSKLNAKIDKYRDEVKPNEGKKIEGTGLIQVPYLMYLAILMGIGMLAWFILKIVAMSNPYVAVGTKAASLGGKFAGKIVSELIGGGESFKNRVVSTAKETFTKAEVLEMFRIEHERKQSTEVQDIVRNLTKV